MAGGDRKRHSMLTRLPMMRARNSETSKASMEITTETMVSRNAPASPPGTWVKV
ncbi:hypothetical protein D3C72_2350120 [compost metagenome]